MGCDPLGGPSGVTGGSHGEILNYFISITILSCYKSKSAASFKRKYGSKLNMEHQLRGFSEGLAAQDGGSAVC